MPLPTHGPTLRRARPGSGHQAGFPARAAAADRSPPERLGSMKAGARMAPRLSEASSNACRGSKFAPATPTTGRLSRSSAPSAVAPRPRNAIWRAPAEGSVVRRGGAGLGGSLPRMH